MGMSIVTVVNWIFFESWRYGTSRQVVSRLILAVKRRGQLNFLEKPGSDFKVEADVEELMASSAKVVRQVYLIAVLGLKEFRVK